MEEKLEYRMYGLVPYNLSPIQQGIQFGHAVVEYFITHYNDCGHLDEDLLDWAEDDKTFIILNGGTTSTKGDPRLGQGGSLNKHLFTLADNKIDVATFYEPDLGDQLTAIVFLVDERVWNKEKYPDRFLGGGPEPNKDGIVQAVYFSPETEEEYEKRLGGPTNVWLREFLKQFRLA